MAKLVHDDMYPHAVRTRFAWLGLFGVGIGIGSLYILLAYVVHSFLLEPLYCGKTLDAVACQSSMENAGNIASIILFVLGALVLALLRIRYALVVALATTITLWGLSGWVQGLLWYEMWGIGILLYALSYSVYAWIMQARTLLVGIIFCTAVMLGLRIIIAI